MQHVLHQFSYVHLESLKSRANINLRSLDTKRLVSHKLVPKRRLTPRTTLTSFNWGEEGGVPTFLLNLSWKPFSVLPLLISPSWDCNLLYNAAATVSSNN